MARIRKHRNKWQVLYRDPTGRERSAGSYRKRIEADRTKRDIENQLDRGEWFDPTLARVTTVGAFAVVWMQSRVDLKPSTKAGYEQILHARVLPRYANFPLSALTPGELQSWVASMVDDGLSPNRVRNVFNVLSGLLSTAVAHKIIRSNPAVGISLPKPHRAEQRYLTPDQVTVLAGEVNPRYQAMILTLGVGGLRVGEATALRRRAIDVIGQRIHVFESVAKVQYPGNAAQWVTSTPKSDKDRHVAIPRHLAMTLNTHLTVYAGQADGLAFTTSTGNRVTSDYIGTHVLKPALRRAGIDPLLRTHDLRHSAAAAMIRANPNPELVKRQLGHSSIQVTYDLYGHLFPDEADRLADALDDIWLASHADQMRTKPTGTVAPIN